MSHSKQRRQATGGAPEAPKVFISYSHDTPAHKKWVGELASKLIEKGVDVILDQWDLGLGDDVPKFMERAVTEADRVLMICTETYVRKADDGKGGVGYEAMIVTGELVNDLGTAKFIPIVRQEADEPKLPKCVSTRFWANLSEGKNFDEELEKVLREVHNAPKLPKPPLGKNPFAGEESGPRGPSSNSPASAGQVSGSDVDAIYLSAVRAVKAVDIFEWREILKHARQRVRPGLAAWRKTFELSGAPTWKDVPGMMDAAIPAVAPLFVVALAGVESCDSRFNNQLGVVDDLLNPRDWNDSGFSVIVNLPDSLVYLYQALHGALCMQTGQIPLAARLARSRFQRRHDGKMRALMEEGEWIGWPKSISESCTGAWEFLKSLPKRHSWVLRLFGTEEDFVAALSAYYSLLITLELVTSIRSGSTESLLGPQGSPNLPPLACIIPAELTAKAYRSLAQNVVQLEAVWTEDGVTTEQMREQWPRWMDVCEKCLREGFVLSRWRAPLIYQRPLFEEPGLRGTSRVGNTSNVV